MNNLLKLLERFHFVILFIILFTISSVLYFNTTYYQKARLNQLTLGVSGFFDSYFSSWSSYFNLQTSNTKLFKENVNLKNRLAYLQQKLKMTADTVEELKTAEVLYRYMPATVVRNAVNQQNNFILIDAGEQDSVMAGMGVICDRGVVGVVVSSAEHFSSVISLLNTDLVVSAKHKKSGVFGSLSWNGIDYRKVKLLDIPLHINLAVGDTIVTSGFSAMFPPDIPLGSIVDFYKKDGRFFDITVELFADFKSLDKVYVVNSIRRKELNKMLEAAEK